LFTTPYFTVVSGLTFGGTYPKALTINDALSLGTAIEISDSDGDTGVPAQCDTGDIFGFLSKQVTADGSSFQDRTLNIEPMAAATGDKVDIFNIRDGGVIEVEGGENVAATDQYTGQDNLVQTAGTGAIAVGTAVKTELSTIDGLWRQAQSGERIRGVLEAQLTPVTTSNVKIRVRLVSRGIKA